MTVTTDHVRDPKHSQIRQPPFFTVVTTYLGFAILYLVGYIEDCVSRLLRSSNSRQGYAPLTDSFDDFFTRKFKIRIDDCFSRPSIGMPGSHIRLINIPGNFKRAQSVPHFVDRPYLNLGSYNYLGLVKLLPHQIQDVEKVITTVGVSLAVAQGDTLHGLRQQVEKSIAEFVSKPAAVICSMGFATNVSAIEVLMGPGNLILSDELNHASIRVASRMCGAQIVSFKHNDMDDLERHLRLHVSNRRCSKIMVVVEGLYSMEGTFCDLPNLVRLRQKYKFYLFVDEAHSIGALGKRGRGICEHFDICPSHVDVLMGTFSKSFGAVGGYVAADRDTIEAIRYGPSMLSSEQAIPAVLAQIRSALTTIQSPMGTQKIRQLRENTTRLRQGLQGKGFTVYGDAASPVVPVLIYQLGKLAAFSREMLEQGIAVVVVGYPATPLHSARVRFCVSAGHTEADIDRVLRSSSEIGDVLMLKHRRQNLT